jgi:hypothetical protein
MNFSDNNSDILGKHANWAAISSSFFREKGEKVIRTN